MQPVAPNLFVFSPTALANPEEVTVFLALVTSGRKRFHYSMLTTTSFGSALLSVEAVTLLSRLTCVCV